MVDTSPDFKRRATDYYDTAQPLITQLPSSSRALRRDREPEAWRCRVAQVRAHSLWIKAGHVHALDHARYGALTVEWKDRLP